MEKGYGQPWLMNAAVLENIAPILEYIAAEKIAVLANQKIKNVLVVFADQYSKKNKPAKSSSRVGGFRSCSTMFLIHPRSLFFQKIEIQRRF
jgi:hypothetical protein